MTPTINALVVPLPNPRYYRSFAAYEIPFRPVEEVTFAGTERLRSYCHAYHDQAGRVVRFDKILLVWAEKEPRLVALSTAEEPGTPVYLAVIPDPSGAEPKIGEQIAYGDTEDREEFFTGEVLPSGVECKVRRFRRDTVFTETYAYWPSGRLRSRVKSRQGQKPVVEDYDADGNKIDEPLPNGVLARE